MKFSQKIAASSALAIGLLFAAGGAGAADRTATNDDIAVRFSDQRVNSPAEAEALYKKLRSAAREVCDANAGGHRTLEVRTRVDRCVKSVLADAVSKINQPLLTSVYEARNGKSNG
ncbi:MAG TPA: UrcA family protein [Steroidobacteraceae bacterium]|nr:UrcA family protein [Steroidobacteraceae bacterium]